MFNFIKNLGKKNKIVSTEFMSWDDFVKEIEPRILEAWTDHELVEKAGIVGLFKNDQGITNLSKEQFNYWFDKNIQITKIMSYEDLCDCIVRVQKMMAENVAVVKSFSEGASERNFNSKENYQKYLIDKKNGKVKGPFVIKDDFFSAKTIEDFFLFEKQKMEAISVELPNNKETAYDCLIKELKTLSILKKTFFICLESTVIANSAIMTGFND